MMKAWKKRSIIFVVIVVLLVIGFAAFFLHLLLGVDVVQTQDISYYHALSGEINGEHVLPILGVRSNVPCVYDLPQLTELKPYEDYRFDYTAKRCSIFESHAYVLIMEYEESEYQVQKKNARLRYSCCSDVIPGEADSISPEFEMDGFDFFAVDGGDYPKEMFFVGTSDERNEIAYIFFYDIDLDYIPGFSWFMHNETGWDKVV